jgi:nucleotide-binding universal stress UspA family protein
MYDKVLVAIDDSEPAGRALEEAGGIAALSKGSVQVLHVRERVVGRRAGAEWYLSNQEDAQALVDSATARLRDHGVAASGVVLDAPQGRVAQAIWDQTDAFGADLVVVGSQAGRRSAGSSWAASRTTRSTSRMHRYSSSAEGC